MKLTIIVTTRERYDTLLHTIRTLVCQDYTDCEFIISDNFSNDKTQEVVRSFDDTRLVYINTGKRISMAENWEFALNHARGEYVGYLGDDDGFLPGALSAAMKIIEKGNTPALIWEKAEYCWPNYIESSMRNLLSIRLNGYEQIIRDGNEERKRVINFKKGYTYLPCIYNGVVKLELIKKLQGESKNGIFFNSISPDVFSALALSAVIGNYCYSNYPFVVNGASKHSNGTAFIRRGTDGEKDNPTTTFYAENTVAYDDRLLLVASVAPIVAGEYLLARKYLCHLDFPDLYWPAYLKAMQKDAKASRHANQVLKSALFTAQKVGVPMTMPEITSPPPEKLSTNKFYKNILNFQPNLDQVSNIYDACILAAALVPNANEIDFVSQKTFKWTKLFKI
jgi:glycosyltransferase involved in cell wall biosynthesis